MGRKRLLLGLAFAAVLAFAVAPASATSPESWDFGTVKIGGTSAPKTFVFGPLEIPVPTDEGLATEGPFRVTAEDCPAVLPMGSTCTGTVVFQPTGIGPIGGSVKTKATGPGGFAQLKGVGGTEAKKKKKKCKKAKKGASAAKKKCKKK